MTPIEYIKERKRLIREIETATSELENLDDCLDFPEAHQLRPATPEDIRMGNIIFYPAIPERDEFFSVIDYILNQNSDFKAYTGHCGCRHGLNGAFVLKGKK